MMQKFIEPAAIFWVLLLIVLIGCEAASGKKISRSTVQPHIEYQIVEIEGHRWIATPGHGAWWSLAGPLPKE